MSKTTDNQIKEILEAAQEVALAEQAILGESLQEKNARIRELESEIRFLKDLLVHWQAAPRSQAQPSKPSRYVPQRWRVKTV